MKKKINLSEFKNPAFINGMSHYHNFPLLTVGYNGGAYITKPWEYDSDKVEGFPEEKVDIKFLEETKLSEDVIL